MRVGIRASQPEALLPLTGYLPPGWRPSPVALVERLYSLRPASGPARPGLRRFHLLYADGVRLARTGDMDELLAALESDLNLFIAERAKRRLFIHAGVVGWRGQALLLPGRSLAGKSTLVAALVAAGATYYSDEFAVLDPRGRVHPFPVPISLRDPAGGPARRLGPEALGGRPGLKPLPVRLVVSTQYRAGARWHPREVTPGQAALELLANTVPARRRPAEVLGILQQAAAGARTLRGARGEAAEVARALLAGGFRYDRG